MHSFLKAEWKTIVVCLLFCGSIYGWFYYQAVEEARQKEKPDYVMTCLDPGKSLGDFKLNTPVAELKLDQFQKVSSDGDLKLETYKSSDGKNVLNIRDGKLASIEYYSDDTEDVCVKDLDFWLKGKSPVAERLYHEKQQLQIYEGLVVIEEVKEVEATEKEAAVEESTEEDFGEESSKKENEVHRIGFMVLNS